MQDKYKEELTRNTGYFTGEAEKQVARDWYQDLRDKLCAIFETLEQECSHDDAFRPATFTRESWTRAEGGGGVMSIMRGGRVFEKLGVNISTVYGAFSEQFRGQIPGTEESGDFWASGLSLVAHPRNPHVPPIHMNTRHIVTGKSWFGGGIDLNPITEDKTDTAFFHQRLKELCALHDNADYDDFKAWCDDYFYLPHRNEHRGIGGIFYDYLNSGDWNADFDFNKAVGAEFLEIYPEIVRRHMDRDWSDTDRAHQLVRRGRYAEFNLLYDRGTVFGLKTGGNPDAILMSLPPLVAWP